MTDKNQFMDVPLRVGLLTDSLIKPQWIYKLVADIQSSSMANIVLTIQDNRIAEKQNSLIHKLWTQRKYWLYKAYSRFDNFIFRVEPDAFKKVSLKPLISNVPVMPVRSVQQRYSDYLQGEDIAAIGEYQLDVILYFGRRILRGQILRIARYGVWSYHHGDNLVNRGGPPGFWEVMENQPVTGSILQILTEDLDGGKVIYRSYAPTHKRSVKRNKNNYYWKSAAFVPRKLEDLYHHGPKTLGDDPYTDLYSPYSHRLYKNPTNREFLPVLLRFGLKTALGKLQELFYLKQWFLTFSLKNESNKNAPAFYQFTPIIPPKDRYWADPFPVKKDDKYFIFIEEYIYQAKKGHIAVIEMDQQGRYSRPVKILEKSYHLSYPFIFHWQGDYYMIPETAQNRKIELYRCVSFPSDWQLETVLLEDVWAADATLAEIDGRWWMFVNIGVEGMTHNRDELHLFYAKTPLGPWQPHRRNPVKSDARSTRPAGHLFRRRGDIYRPAQDCSERYGYAISINKVDQLTPDRFVETEVSKILPQWSKNIIATHTLNEVDGLTVIDGMLKLSNFDNRYQQ
jgi:hypothetical protein